MFQSRTGGSGHAQCSIRELSSGPPRYDAKPAGFALNQGSRKLCSGGVTCPGLIRCAGLEHIDLLPPVGKHDDFIKNKLLYLQNTQTVYKIFL